MYFIAYKKNLSLEVRSKFALINKKFPSYYEKLKEIFKEAIIINTCNRTEIYIVPKNNILDKKSLIDEVFEVFNWDKSLKEHILLQGEEATVRHLMEVACGFHSKILGEDQILAQIKDSLNQARENKASGDVLQRLFQEAITCGKKFRTNCKLNEIPVSISSIAVKKAINENCNNIAVIGYGEIGKLTLKYLQEGHNIENIYIIVRDLSKVEPLEDSRVKFISYNDKNKILDKLEGIISCTSAPHYVIKEEELSKDRAYSLFDLAVPRDIDEKLALRENINLYDVDTLSVIDYKNKKLREKRINDNKYIVKEYIDEFYKWKKVKKLFPVLSEMNKKKNEVVEERIKTFYHKKETKDIEDLAKTLLESVAKSYVNKAIEVLKDEAIKGRDKECMEILQKIFL